MAAILLAALALRVYGLDRFPAGAQHDEVFDSGFALSIVQGARPAFFDANGGVPALFMYIMAPAIAAFGRSLLVARAVAVVCGLASLIASYILLRSILGRGIALVAVAAMSVSFWHLFSSRAALEPITVPLVAALTFYCLWRGLQEGGIGWFAAGGVFLGLAPYTYHSGPLVPLTVVLYTVYLAIFHRTLLAKRLPQILVCGAVAAVVFAPMALHVASGAAAATSRVRDLSGHLAAAQSGNLAPLAGDILATVGMFGWQGDPEWRYNLSGRPVFEPLGAMLFYAGYLIALRRFRRPEYGLLLVWLPANLLFSAITPPSPSTLRSIGGIAAAFAFPAISLGTLWDWLGSRWGKAGRGAVAALTAGWLAVSGAMLLNDYFVVWANHPEVRTVYRAGLAEAARYLDAADTGEVIAISAPYAADLDRQSFEMAAAKPHDLKWFDGRRALVWPATTSSAGATLVLPDIGQPPAEAASRLLAGLRPAHVGLDPRGQPAFTVYQLTADELAARRDRLAGTSREANWNDQVGLTGFELPAQAATGASARVWLYWRVLSELHPPDDEAPVFSIHLLDEHGELWSQENYQAVFPSQWDRDDRVASWFDLAVPVDAPPGRYRVTAGLTAAGKELPVRGAAGWEPGRVTLGEVQVVRGPVPTGAVDLHIRFPRRFDYGAVTLLGANGLEATPAGKAWLLSLYWQARPDGATAAAGDLSIGVCMYGNSDELVYEWRGVLLEGIYPTSRWQPGEYVRTSVYVPIPAGLPASKGRVRINLYDAAGHALGTEPGLSIIGLAIVPDGP